ncbi:MAG TPA: 3-hydroxyisobutyryl-CoA hydrolase [Microbacteriaceae bacterium]|jgi:enoyl-CoA hydratase|nr:3-hydroxyisobutyryl-CoA hydrolase [Microbacteriaceae bacterium]
MTATVEAEVLVERRGNLGHILLNRPRALNSLTPGMVATIASTLAEWHDDDVVQVVAISGAGERGLCAGGDIVGIYSDLVAASGATARFWADEYRLNSAIANYPKPVVAIMDGLVLGGGVGISAHASVRVVTERSKVGMPEVGIGFVPDVGGTYLLSRAPGELGTHFALTGASMTGPEAIAAGFADHEVASADLPDLLVALQGGDAAGSVARFAVPRPVPVPRAWIDECYSSDDALEILSRLEASSSDDAREAGASIRAKSPTSVVVTLASLRRAALLPSLESALDQEYRVGLRIIEGGEMIEGIRAQVIDKDRTPQWNPASIAEVDDAAVDRHFADLGDRELGLQSTTATQRSAS